MEPCNEIGSLKLVELEIKFGAACDVVETLYELPLNNLNINMKHF